MPRNVKASSVTFEEGNIFISGELYGTESQYHADCESGKIVIQEEKTFYEKWNDGDAGCTNLG